jgi:glutathione S-transferase
MLKINPLGKVPALEIEDGSILVDSRIIIDFLEGLAEDETKLIPVDFVERREVLQIEAIALGLVETSVELRIELYRKNPAAHDPNWISRLEQQIGSALTWLENCNPSPLLCGSKLSLPDITTVAAYTYLRNKLPDLVLEGKYPSLEKLWEHCEGLSEFRSAQYSESEALASEL